jgi:hypothetical protein
LDVTALRFSEADGNRRTGKTGQSAQGGLNLSRLISYGIADCL